MAQLPAFNPVGRPIPTPYRPVVSDPRPLGQSIRTHARALDRTRRRRPYLPRSAPLRSRPQG
jgi:hypothetical protein